MYFAERLKNLRKKKGVSHARLTEKVEVHFTQVSPI